MLIDVIRHVYDRNLVIDICLLSQQALFQHSADILGGLLADLPQDKVAQVNKRLHEVSTHCSNTCIASTAFF